MKHWCNKRLNVNGTLIIWPQRAAETAEEAEARRLASAFRRAQHQQIFARHMWGVFEKPGPGFGPGLDPGREWDRDWNGNEIVK